MAAITTTSEVARPSEEVFAYATNPARVSQKNGTFASGCCRGMTIQRRLD
jgi:hypothetical protein